MFNIACQHESRTARPLRFRVFFGCSPRGPGQPGPATSCLVQPRPKTRALFLNQNYQKCTVRLLKLMELTIFIVTGIALASPGTRIGIMFHGTAQLYLRRVYIARRKYPVSPQTNSPIDFTCNKYRQMLLYMRVKKEERAFLQRMLWP